MLLIIVLAIIIMFTVYQDISKIAALNEYIDSEKKYSVYKTSKSWILIMAALLILCIFIGTDYQFSIIYVEKNIENALYCYLIALMIFLDLLFGYKLENIYYGKNYIYLDNKKIIIKSIKNISINKLFCNIETYQGEIIKTSKKKGSALKKIMDLKVHNS